MIGRHCRCNAARMADAAALLVPAACRRESVAINSSLMTLGRCLEALRWNQQHKGGGNLRVVPYRESKVTHLFRWAGSMGRCEARQAECGSAMHIVDRASKAQAFPCPACRRDALHGWGQVLLSVNVSPASKDYDETAHVLKVGGSCGHRRVRG